MIELLAPAGSYESVIAAVENGADAVYLGGTAFNARYGAKNFTDEELIRAINYCHLRDSKVYITLNTLIKDSEMSRVAEYIGFLVNSGADALIVQDIGLVKVIKDISDIPIHASTQMTVHNTTGVKLIEAMGISRVVSARELTLNEIKDIKNETNIELEFFVHGALCSSVSGQCLFSSIIGGRSGNRGKCAQPCRLKYSEATRGNSGHLLSVKDICMLPVLKELIDAGITSLKIEGRMKRPEYVACVTSIYRKAIDNISKGVKPYTQSDLDELLKMFNRGGFIQGYLKGRNTKVLFTEHCGNQGIVIGKVNKIFKDKASIKLYNTIRVGDIIEYGQSPDSVRVDTIEQSNKRGDEANNGEVLIKYKDVKLNDPVRLVLDSAQHDKWNSLIKENNKKLKIDMEFYIHAGKAISLTITDNSGTKAYAVAEIAQEAKSEALSTEKIENQLSKLGNTPYITENIRIDTDNKSWIPISRINEIRRLAIDSLNEQKTKRLRGRYYFKNNDITADRVNIEKEQKLCVEVSDLNMLSGIKNLGLVDIYYSPAEYSNSIIIDIQKFIRKYNKKPWLVLPQISFNEDITLIDNLLYNIRNILDGIIVSNIGQIYLKDKYSLPARSNSPMNVFNSESINVLKDYGINGITVSLELKLSEIKAIKNDDSEIEIIAYGRIPLMAFAYCPRGNQCADCDYGLYKLKDRSDRVFNVKRVKCFQCINYLMNSDILDISDKMGLVLNSNIKRIRIIYGDDMTESIDSVINKFLCALKGEKVEPIGQRTSGHYFRGVD